MDITFKTEGARFNLRAAAIMINDGKVLAMSDERSPYFYLPGGKIALNETAEEAALRELREELGIEGSVVRPLYIAQSFFTEEGSGERFHEICFYLLVDCSSTDLLSRGESFIINERHHTLEFKWLDVNALEDAYFYPTFLRERMKNLPEGVEMITERR
ncbi:MAG: NUDIX domain-containing protein [Clostridia bacterium]|nr:NUDIX domain-containing protein [Clostridia bacterium]